ncbi:MAG TPA: hypothetical protein VFN67_34785 [Polyangiales bacterium]|nr:hypothetical protein [Polyangiales bacterium]
MRRIVLCHVCMAMFALVLSGCELLDQLPPWMIDGDSDSDPNEPVDTVTIEHARQLELLGRGRVLSVTTQGLRILDVRDPQQLRVEGAYPIGLNTPAFYRMGEHVILVVDFAAGYRGARDDLPLRRDGSGLLLNIDIRDRAQPRLVNEVVLADLPRSHLMRSAPEGDALFVLPMIWNGERYQSRLERYELREGTLVNTGQLMLDATAEAIAATSQQLLAATQSDDNFRVNVIDMTSLTQVFSAKLPGRVAQPTQMIIDHAQLRVLYQDISGTSAIETFDLSSPGAYAPTGHCALDSMAFFSAEARLFSSYVSSFFHSEGELERFAFDVNGNCGPPTTFGADTRSYALQELGPTRLLTLGTDAVSLYDSQGTQPLARAALEVPLSAASAVRTLQLSQLPGTSAPQLVGVPYAGHETQGRFQLLTLADDTLSARASLRQRGYPETTALLGRTLLTVSSTELHAYDVQDLDRPVAQGELELAESYPYLFGFGDYVARVRSHPWVLPPEERAVSVQDDLQVLRRSATGERGAPIASLPVESVGEWVQVGPVLVNLQLSVADYGNGVDPIARITVQAYDLRDPKAPRKAGKLSTTEIDAEWTGGHFTEPYIQHATVGGALIIPQTKRAADEHVRSCWRAIDFDACAMSDCETDRYTGLILCRRVNADPETCTVQSFTHCTAEKCEALSTVPDGIPSVEQECNEYDQPGQASTFAFNVIDLRDPDQPSLVRPAVELPGADQRQSYFVSGDKIFATERSSTDVLSATELDFSDPRAPTLSARRVVPGEIVAATEHDVYTAPRGYDLPTLTLSRIPCCQISPQPGAARAWAGRELLSVTPDGAGHLLLLHAPRAGAAPSPDARADWTRLEILDAQSLATLGSLPVDDLTSGNTLLSDGRLLIDGSGALFLVDVRDPSSPQLQAVLPHVTGPTLFERGQLSLSDELGFRSYPADIEN